VPLLARINKNRFRPVEQSVKSRVDPTNLLPHDLEVNFGRELDLAGQIELARYYTGGSAIESRIRRRKQNAIKQVECFNTQLQFKLLVNPSVLDKEYSVRMTTRTKSGGWI